MRELIKWLSIADRFTRLSLDKNLANLNINNSQYFYILKICENPGITQDKLQSFIHVNPSNITRALNQLEKTGFLLRFPNEQDKRTFHLFPTEQAKKAYSAILEAIQQSCESLTYGFTEQEKQQFLFLLKKSASNILALENAKRFP
ncbi:MarR family transcriptional regulator [Massilioclostridium coli]|uniref:MarR family transcriptional regulator n=1 Tax=Massilioclostridium coli TaxID=1870991 RepID=UPI00085CDD28|nr:MarR family transcriptional regulator [Massilioclostridium coli]